MFSKTARRHKSPPSISLRGQIVSLFLVATLVGLIAMLAFLSNALEKEVFTDVESYLRTKAHSVQMLLLDQSVSSDALTRELNWEPGTDEHLTTLAYVEKKDGSMKLSSAGSGSVWAELNSMPIQDGFSVVSIQNGNEFAVMRLDDSQYSVRLAVDISNQLSNLEAQKWIFRAVLILSAVLLVFLSLILGRIATEPLERLATKVTELSIGAIDDIQANQFPKELKPVVDELNRFHHERKFQIQSLSRFAANAAHELRTPINVLIGEAELALSRERTIPEYQATVASALEEYRSLSHLIEQLLFIARAERGKELVQIQAVDLKPLVQSLTEIYGPVAHDQETALQNSVPSGLQIWADSNLLKRAIGNLVINSIQALKTKGTVVVEAIDTEQAVIVIVRDNGPGFGTRAANHNQQNTQVQPASASSGSGLGLSIVHSIVRLHKGTVDLKERPEGGTEIRMTFPKPSSP